MKLKPLIVAVACLAILSGIVFWINRSESAPPADPRVDQPLLSAGTAAAAAKIVFADQGKSISLTRSPDGTWRVDSYFGLPADFDKLSRFVSDLTDAKIQRLVTDNPERIARLDFKDTKISLSDSAGKELWSATLGKSPDSGGRFVRFGSEGKAYLANVNAWLDTEPKNWADAQLINLKSDDVAKVEIPFDGGSSVLVARTKKDDPWTSAESPAGQRVSADKMASLVSSIAALRFSDTADPSDPRVSAARSHEREFKLTLFDGKAYSISLGRKPEEKKPKPADTVAAGPVYAYISTSDEKAPVNALMKKRAFQIDDYTFTGLPQKPADLFEPVPPAKSK